VKTATSVPDPTFDEATKRARQLGMSRSQFFPVAVRRYLDELEHESLTEQLNEALALAHTDDSAAAAVRAGQRRLKVGDDW
jgi:metal-responsive CopG/Arc/MetJ family transcriptional regulator